MGLRVVQDGVHSPSLEQVVDEDIKAFDVYFQSLGNDPLDRFERAAIKTYLWYKLHREGQNATISNSSV